MKGSNPVVLAVGAHPDDIEFCMAGTLAWLVKQGWEGHCWNLSTGSCGSLVYRAKKLRKMRADEARAAAATLGVQWHPPLVDDLEIFYEKVLLRRVASVLRSIRPVVILTHPLADYMEDHVATARLVVTAAFARSMPNFSVLPARATWQEEVLVYHSMPHGLQDSMRRAVVPEFYVDTTAVHGLKMDALKCHVSQQAWLDASQGMNSYLASMNEMSRHVGRLSKRFRHAEGWRRHSHLGFCSEDFDPLRAALRSQCKSDPRYPESLRLA